MLNKIYKSVLDNQNKIAFFNDTDNITYKELWDKGKMVSSWILSKISDKSPIIIYGHKDIQMPIGFLACIQSGLPYCPIDTSMPVDRIKNIYYKLDEPLIINTTDKHIGFAKNEYLIGDILNIVKSEDVVDDNKVLTRDVDNNRIIYIIFTSGSTGEPKGVKVTSNNLLTFVTWINEIIVRSVSNSLEQVVFLNQAPLSFDLSVMDLYSSLTSGGKVYLCNKSNQLSSKVLMDRLSTSNINVIVSTPSFAELCLSDENFNGDKIDSIECFLFCGERLTKNTASTIKQRFRNARIFNTYGPTEATVAVTSVEITDETIEKNKLLPIGYEKAGVKLNIENIEQKYQDGKIGEIVIYGDSVAAGYYGDIEKTNEVFGFDEKGVPFYKTGDLGYIENNMFYCIGRKDSQIKFRGYRIELSDIEENLYKVCDIKEAVVFPYMKNDTIKYLVAVVSSNELEDNFASRKIIKEQLKQHIPDYMIPKKIIVLKKLPINNNGKIDRKLIGENLNELL